MEARGSGRSSGLHRSAVPLPYASSSRIPERNRRNRGAGSGPIEAPVPGACGEAVRGSERKDRVRLLVRAPRQPLRRIRQGCLPQRRLLPNRPCRLRQIALDVPSFHSSFASDCSRPPSLRPALPWSGTRPGMPQNEISVVSYDIRGETSGPGRVRSPISTTRARRYGGSLEKQAPYGTIRDRN
jgi:hypothetical protein